MTELQRRVLAYLYAIGSDYGILGHFDIGDMETLDELANMGLAEQEPVNGGNYYLTPAGRALFDHIGE